MATWKLVPILLLACVCLSLTNMLVWANDQVLDTNQFVTHSNEVLDDPQVRGVVSARMVQAAMRVEPLIEETILAVVDALIDLALQTPILRMIIDNPLADILLGDAVKRLLALAQAYFEQLARYVVNWLFEHVLDNPAVRGAIDEEVRHMHGQLTTNQDGGLTFAVGPIKTLTIAGVTIDIERLRSFLVALAFVVDRSLIDKIPDASSGVEIELLPASTVQPVRTVAEWVPWLIGLFGLLAIGLVVLVVWRGRSRTRAVRWVGAFLIGTAVVNLGLVWLVHNQVIPSLASNEDAVVVGQALFGILDDALIWQTLLVGGLGCLILLAGLLGAWLARREAASPATTARTGVGTRAPATG
jgi:hypothetical protein